MWRSSRFFTDHDAKRDEGGDEQEEEEIGRTDATRQQLLFPDSKAMKEHMRAQMIQPEYDVANFYHTTGFCQWMARHGLFEKSTLVVIAANAVWIAVDTDYNRADVLLDAQPLFQIAEHLFCMYFLFEWTMRFCAFRSKFDCRKDGWFVFDSLLVGTMVVETWVMTALLLMLGNSSSGGLGNASILRMARLLRLTRMARMARLLRAMPELLILIKGMMAAMRSVFFTLALLILIIYVFGIAFTQLCADAACSDEFNSVLTSMHMLLVNGALMDNLSGIIQPLHAEGVVLLIVFYVFLLLAALTIMNMLIGVICEVVSAVAATEREQMTLAEVKEKIQELMSVSDSDGDNMISKAEFMALLTNKKAAVILDGVGVDVFSLVDFVDYIFADDSKELSFADVMNLVLDLRGSNTATVKDILDLRRFIKIRFNEIEEAVRERPSCMSTDVRSHLSMDDKQDPPKSAGTEVSTDVELRKDEEASLLHPPNGSSLESMNFKKLLDRLSAHEHEIAAMKVENSLRHGVVPRPQMATAARPLPLPRDAPSTSLSNQANSGLNGAVDALWPENAPGAVSEHTSGSGSGSIASRDDTENDHGCASSGYPSSPVTTRPPATGHVWDPPVAPLGSDCRSLSHPWFSSARVVPIATVEHDHVEAIH